VGLRQELSRSKAATPPDEGHPPVQAPADDEINQSLNELAPDMAWAMETASKRTKGSTRYLLNTARLETNFDPTRKWKKSSAAGLYQFHEQTWLQLAYLHGGDYGWVGQSGHVTCNSKRCNADPGDRERILELRYEPVTATCFAAELARHNKDYIESEFG